MKLRSILNILSGKNDTKKVFINPNLDLQKEYFELAKEMTKRKEFNNALENFNKALEVNPKNILSAEILLERSKVKYLLNDNLGGERDLIKAKDFLNLLDEALKAYELAIEFSNSDNYESSLKAFNKAISLNPGLTGVYYNRGCTKELLKDFYGAIEDYTLAIDSKASNCQEAYFKRGYLKQYKIKDNEGALFDYNKAFDLNYQTPEILYHRSKLLNDLDALRDLNDAEKQGYGKANSNLYFELYYRKLNLDDYAGGIIALDQYINANPLHGKVSISNAYHLKGFLYLYQNEFEFAIKNFDNSIALNNNNPDSYYWRGQAKNKSYGNKSGELDIQTAINLGYKID